MPWVFLAVSIVGALLTLNAYRPSRNQYLMALSFFPAWLTTELALFHLVWQALATVAFVAAGALDAWPGWLGLAITAGSWIGLGRIAGLGGRRAESAASAALADLLDDEAQAAIADRVAPRGRSRLRRLLLPFSFRDRRVRVERNIPFARAGGRELKLDIIGPREPVEGAPVLLHVHGGAWVLGFKTYQAMPLMTALAASGWVCVNIDYRLSPMATFPDHLVDVKRAIAWIRDHIAERGGDPHFVVVTGGSAGGHLTSLTALTANDPEYQPGFEHVDTSVQAAVPFYGIYDFTNRLGTMPDRWITDFLAPLVMKTGIDDDPDAYRKASPLDRVHPDAPPFFVVHGTRDNLAPVEDARLFVDLLRQASPRPVGYLEVPGAHHAFDNFHSGHSRAAVQAVIRFMLHVHAGYEAAARGDAAAGAAADSAAGAEGGDPDPASGAGPSLVGERRGE